VLVVDVLWFPEPNVLLGRELAADEVLEDDGDATTYVRRLQLTQPARPARNLNPSPTPSPTTMPCKPGAAHGRSKDHRPTCPKWWSPWR
jgi:hypothetical protein